MTSDQGIIVKAYLDSSEIRRFLLESGVATSFEYLKQKTHHIFKIPQEENIKFCWKDADNEYIMLSSDEELVEALSYQKDGIFRLYLNRCLNSSDASAIHANVVCDGCQGVVRGTRYKCVVCPDYDLCSRCENAGKHLEHDMMCVRRPVSPCNFAYWRDFYQTMNMRGAQQSATPPPPHPGMMRPIPPGMPQHWPWGNYPWQCRKMWKKAWKCHQKMQRDNSRVRDSGTCGATASPSPAQPEHPRPETSEPQQPKEAKWGDSQKEFLKSMGEVVQSMLDPFGIDVSFSVEGGSSSATDSLPTVDPQPSEKPTNTGTAPTEIVDVEAVNVNKDDVHKSPQNMNVDLDSCPSSPGAQRTAEFIVIDPDDVETPPPPPPSQKVVHSLGLMKRMGFKDNDGWLTKLLIEHDGEIDKALDVIQSRCKSQTSL